MIVNSQPYSAGEQRCIGLTQPQQPLASIRQQDTRQASMLAAGGQQQNSLYGLPGFEQHHHQATGESPDLLDLAHLQQGAPFDQTANSQHQNPTATNMHFNTNNNIRQDHTTTRHHNDVSLYSPSSSTSLLYHIYDQINVPQELQKQSHLHHHHQSNEQQQQQRKLNNTTTILNPANLFGGQPLQQQQHALPLKGPMSMYQQQQQQQQQHCYGSSPAPQYLMANGSQQQQPLFHQNQGPANTMHHSQSSYQSSVALETALRQHHHATLARHQPRPLSSSAASSISGQSAYAHRQLGPSGLRLPVLGSKQTLPGLLHTGARSHLPLPHHQHLSTGGPRMSAAAGGPPNLGSSGKLGGVTGSGIASSIEAKWKQCSRGMRHMVHQYRVPLRYSILLILLAFSFMSIIKFTLMSAPTASSSQEQQVSSSSLATPFSHHLFPASSSSSNPSSSNTFYPQLASGGFAKTLAEANAGWLPEPSDLDEQQKSKLVTGEFVIINQNYSHSQMHRSFLGKQIVQLMDQVFLGSEMRRVYLKMEITDVRPAKPAGITVSCNIVLRESIPVAAQQFGVALYNSLTKTQERLANHSYIIDRSSIKFNTVPDKDLRSGVLPASVLSHFLSSSADNMEAPPGGGGFATGQPGTLMEPMTPPLDGATSSASYPDMMEPPAGVSSQDPLLVNGAGGPAGDFGSLLDPQEAVVWSEWSPWSSCVDKNGLCDSGRLHSRLRRCINQTSAQVLEASLCKQRFNSDDRNIEVEDCSRTCGAPSEPNPVMSDAPSSSGGGPGPQTAPPLFGPGLNEGPAGFLRLAGALTSTEAAARLLLNHTQDPLGAFSSSTAGAAPADEQLLPASAGSAPTLAPLKGADQLSCSNCTSDEICLLLVQQKVPFCAKIKERADETGCGGWCRSPGHLCQPVGQNAFKCVHDSECLAEEWRCHDSACIPSTNRCDGHPNCFDSSDELDCPA